MDATRNNALTDLISRLGEIRLRAKALSYGDYKELLLTTGQYAFSRNYNGESVLVSVNNSDDDFVMRLPVQNAGEHIGGLTGTSVCPEDGYITVNVKANSGEIWLPVCVVGKREKPIKLSIDEKAAEAVTTKEEVKTSESEKEKEPVKTEDIELKHNKAFEEMTVEELQEAILNRMKRNGPVTEQMRRDVIENVYHNSLVTWVKSFN